MKKIILFVLCACLLVCLGFLPQREVSIGGQIEDISMVVSAQKAAERGLEFVQNGSDAILSCLDQSSAKAMYEMLQPKCVEFKISQENLENLKKNLKITLFEVQKLEDSQIIYAFSPLIKDFVWVNGKKFNVQIVLQGERLSVGIPAIMTSF